MTDIDTKSYDDLKSNESLQSNENLQNLIKEIDELKDKNRRNDKIESGIIVNENLNNELKTYLERNKDVAKTLINHINSIKTNNLSEDVIKDLQKLVKLLSEVIYGSTEGIETEENEPEFENQTDMANESFYKLMKLIKEKGDLSSLNQDQEFQNIINFINDDDNNAKTLGLYIGILSSTEETNNTNKEVLNRFSEAIRNHFKIQAGTDIDAVKEMQLNEIFKNAKTKKELEDVYEEYTEENQNGNNPKGSTTRRFRLNIDQSKFMDRYNKQLSNVNFSNTIDKIGKNMNSQRVDSINKSVNTIMGEAGNEFLKYESNKLKYDIGKVRKFLGAINVKNYNKVKTEGKAAWISAVQIFLNQTRGEKLTVDGAYTKGGETYNSVLNFQKDYNKNNKDRLREDGIPGPQTLNRLLSINTNNNGGGIEGIDTSGFDQDELDILNVNSEKFYDGYNYSKEEIEAHHRYKRGRIIEKIQKYVQKFIAQNEDIGKQKIINHVRTDLVTLPKKEKAEILQGIRKVVDKFNKTREYLDFKNGRHRGKYPNAKSLICGVLGIKKTDNITNNITVKQHGVGLAFFVEDKNSYYILNGRGKPSGQGSGGFNCSDSAIPDLKGTISVINGKDPGLNVSDYAYTTLIHEGQHNRNTYFMPDKEKYNDPIKRALSRAKDEITAYLRDGRSIPKIEEILTKPKSKGGLYNYGLEGQDRENHKAKVIELLGYVKYLMGIVKKGIGLTKDKVISMLSDTPATERKNMYDKIMQAVKNGSNLREYRRTGTAQKETAINEINFANTIKDIKYILSDPKYSHIPREPDDKGGIEISAMIDKIEKGDKDYIKYIPPSIKNKVENLINQ